MANIVDRDFCNSSYLAFRYIEDRGKNFSSQCVHNVIPTIPEYQRILVETEHDVDRVINEQLVKIKAKYRKPGLFLSGGMDSAILASYLGGCDAYTFRTDMGGVFSEELERAIVFAKYYGLNLHYVDIKKDGVFACVDKIMMYKGAPVHSIEPQLYLGAMQAKLDGIDCMIIGDGSDYVFGGMDKLLSQDWTFNNFVNRYMYTNPGDVLVNPVDMSYLFERYRINDDIDFVKFLDDIATEESYDSYWNAFNVAQMPYFDPYAIMKVQSLDLDRIRNGESKYIVRALYNMKYPDLPIPEKNPMPRPVDEYFKNWNGPIRPEFKKNLDMSKFTGNQKWQMWCLERFLNLLDNNEL